MTLALLLILALVCWISFWSLRVQTKHDRRNSESQKILDPSTTEIVINNPADRWVDGSGRAGYLENPITIASPLNCIGARRGGQIGTLTGNVNGMTTVLPLLGHESPTRRSRWHYYTYCDQINKQPMPVFVDGKDCMANIGCPEILDSSMNMRVAPYNADFEAYLFT